MTADHHVRAAGELVRAMNDLPGYARAAGIEVVNADESSVELRLTKRPDLVQFNDTLHGGVIAGLADHAGGAAVTAASGDRLGVTVDLHLTLLHPATGKQLVARARPVQVGSTIGVASVELHSVAVDGTEKLCALAAVTTRLVPLPAGAS